VAPVVAGPAEGWISAAAAKEDASHLSDPALCPVRQPGAAPSLAETDLRVERLATEVSLAAL